MFDHANPHPYFVSNCTRQTCIIRYHSINRYINGGTISWYSSICCPHFYCNCLEFFKIYFIVACAQARTNDLTLKWSSSRGTNWNQQYQGGINTGSRRTTANISSLNITYSNNDMSPFKARIIYFEIKSLQSV